MQVRINGFVSSPFILEDRNSPAAACPRFEKILGVMRDGTTQILLAALSIFSGPGFRQGPRQALAMILLFLENLFLEAFDTKTVESTRKPLQVIKAGKTKPAINPPETFTTVPNK